MSVQSGVSIDLIYETALNHGGNLQATANTLGRSRSSIFYKLKRAGLLARLRSETSETTNTSYKEKLNITTKGEVVNVEYLGSSISTEEELLKATGLDMTLYDIERVVVNNWEVAGKKSKSEGSGVWKTGLRQVKITLKRKKSEHIAVESILAKLEAASPVMLKTKYPQKPKDIKHKRALEVSVMDPHYGMQCFQGESDHSWGLEQCEQLCMWSIDELIKSAKAYGPYDEIVFPFGNDFMHHDNMMHTTTKGTLQPEAMPFQYVYERAIQLAIAMVERLAEVAPVKVVQVSGNHDHVTTFTLGHVLKAYYRNDPNVEVDVSPSPYKFYRFGTNLIGFDHGHHIKAGRLAALMAHERIHDWAATTFREWHLGDQHRKGSSKPITMEEQGVSVEYLPALTPPNAWHKLKAFNWQQRGAMAFVWDHDAGPKARLQVNLNSYTGKPTGI